MRGSLPTATGQGHGRQRGVALLMVVFVIVLMSMLAVPMLESGHLGIERTANLRELEQGYQLALGSERWARLLLDRDMDDSEHDHPGEVWARLGGAVTVEEGALQTAIEDRAGRFNLNNLGSRDELWYPAFRRLLRMLDLNEDLADSVVDWIDADQNLGHVDSAEDPRYLLEDPPYRAANGPLAEVGELVRVRGFDAAAVARLAPYVSALPASDVRINVNTCPPLLLRIFADNMSESDAAILAETRAEHGFGDLDEFLDLPQLAGPAHVAAAIMASVSSRYFAVRSTTRFGAATQVLESLIARDGERKVTRVLRRSRYYL